jgi:nitrate/TMAO reductase-like tetraheme cytochrome c subunit
LRRRIHSTAGTRNETAQNFDAHPQTPDDDFECEMKKRALIGMIVAIVVIVAAAMAIWIFLPARLPPASASLNCASCHGDNDRLAELSEQPDRYYVDPVQFAQEAHGGLACTTCHGGDPTKETPQEACLSGKAFKNPAATEIVTKTCGSCHADITTRHVNSIHTSLDGIRLSLVDLLGEKEGTWRFQGTCNACHTTCSSCHMEEPDSRNLLWPRVTNHHFESASNSKVCVACHAGMGDTFFGTTIAPKHAPSLMAQAGMQCVDCHGDKDVHGTGTKTSFSMQSPKPSCKDCHMQPAPKVTSAKDTLVAPQYSLDTAAHKMHPETTLACEACHTQWYPSCWNCHDGRTDKYVESLYLAVSPLTNKIQPAAHSPATSGASGPIPTAMGGGWAIKSRHSWGASHTCEACHTDPAVYITGSERESPFVGYWSSQRANAHFVDEKLAQALVIDSNQLKQSAHKDQSCDDCHQSLTDQVCTDCHTKTPKTGTTFLPADGDWSRSSYLAAQTNLDKMGELIQKAQAAGTNVTSWQDQRGSLKASYLQSSNDFHSHPGEAQAKSQLDRMNSQALLQNMQQTVRAQEFQKQVLPAGVFFGAGLIGFLALGLGMSRRQKR